MAFTITNVYTEAELFVADVEATADADVGPLLVPHGLQAAPNDVSLTPLLVEYYLSEWIISAIGAVNIELTKANAVGSGVVGDQIRVTARLSFNPTQEVRQPDREIPPTGSVG